MFLLKLLLLGGVFGLPDGSLSVGTDSVWVSLVMSFASGVHGTV